MKAQHEVQAGVFILVALLLLTISIWVLGQERQFFSRQQEYHTVFTDIQGLSEGAGVRLGGISIGRVSGFSFAPDIKKQKIEVSFLVNDSFTDRIRDDSVVTLQTQGLLGDKFLNILPGTSDVRLKPGETLKSQDASDVSQMLAKASTVVDNTVGITESVNTFMKNFDKETLDSLASGFKMLGELAKEVKNGEGLLHRLVFSKKDGDQIVADLKNATDSISSVLAEVKSGDGLLHGLIYEKAGPDTVANLSKAGGSLDKAATVLTEIVTQIKSGEGLAHDLIYKKQESAGIDETLVMLNETVTNLKSASEALARGSGTLGALLVDSQLYDNLVEVTDGAKRSFILRQAIRGALDNKEKATDKQQ